MSIKGYKDLIVWQKAMDFVEMVYRETKNFPKEELYSLTSQIRRAATSIPSNIAEGQARKSTAEFKHFLSFAKGSLAEVETQLLIAQRLSYINPKQLSELMDTHEQIGKMLTSLLARLSSRT